MLFTTAPTGVKALRAYDCKHVGCKIQAIDTTKVGDCPDPETDFAPVEIRRAQILGSGGGHAVEVARCEVHISRDVTTCGDWSDTFGTRGITWDKEWRLPTADCWEALRTGFVTIFDRTFELTIGLELKEQWFSQGGLDANGVCTWADPPISYRGVSYRRAYEQSRIRITITRSSGTRNPSTGMISLAGGVLSAPFSDGHSWDAYEGLFLWETTGSGDYDCAADTLTEYYNGDLQVFDKLDRKKAASKRAIDRGEHAGLNQEDVDMSHTGAVLVVGLQNKGQHMGIMLGGSIQVCGKICHQVTNLRGHVACFYNAHNHALFPEAAKGLGQVSSTERGRLMLAINDNKALSDYQFIQTNMIMQGKLANMVSEMCRIEKLVLEGKIQSISNGGNRYAMMDLYGPGYLLAPAGPGVAYLTECFPVQVRQVHYANCSEEVPVVRVQGGINQEAIRNQSQSDPNQIEDSDAGEERVVFMDPVNLILQDLPTVRACSALLPARWFLVGHWFCSFKTGVKPCEAAPVRLQPGAKLDAGSDDSWFTRALMSQEGLLTDEQTKSTNDLYDMQLLRNAVASSDLLDRVLGAENGDFSKKLSSQELQRLLDRMKELNLPTGFWAQMWWVIGRFFNPSFQAFLMLQYGIGIFCAVSFALQLHWLAPSSLAHVCCNMGKTFLIFLGFPALSAKVVSELNQQEERRARAARGRKADALWENLEAQIATLSAEGTTSMEIEATRLPKLRGSRAYRKWAAKRAAKRDTLRQQGYEDDADAGAPSDPEGHAGSAPAFEGSGVP